MTTEPRWFFNQLATILMHGDDTNDRVDMVEMTNPPGDWPPLHVHHDQEETWYVLEGEITVYTPGEERVLRAGDFLLAPRGVPHTYRTGDAGARTIVQSSPAGFAAFVDAVSQPEPSEPTPEQAAHVAAVAAEHGIELLGPPGARP
jgi:quercetin dioxygenase-like cupin family protein